MPIETLKERLVLMVLADPVMQRYLGSLVSAWGYEAVLTSTVDEALAALAHNDFVFCLLDPNLDGADGIEFLRRLKIQGGNPGPIILLTNGNGFQRTIEATALGADDFLKKPFTPDELENVIKSALARPRQAGAAPPTTARGAAPAGAQPLAQPADAGGAQDHRPGGARGRHRARLRRDRHGQGSGGAGDPRPRPRAGRGPSSRSTAPRCRASCWRASCSATSAAPSPAPTSSRSASSSRPITARSSSTRSGICTRRCRPSSFTCSRTGSSPASAGRATIKVDVRVLAATNQNLEQAVAAGRFREDLFYRLNVIQIVVPPLRERPEEIPVLADYFIRRYSALYQKETGSAASGDDAAADAPPLPGQRAGAGEHDQADDRARRSAAHAERLPRRGGPRRGPRRAAARGPRRASPSRTSGGRPPRRPSARPSSACSRRRAGTASRPRRRSAFPTGPFSTSSRTRGSCPERPASQ